MWLLSPLPFSSSPAEPSLVKSHSYPFKSTFKWIFAFVSKFINGKVFEFAFNVWYVRSILYWPQLAMITMVMTVIIIIGELFMEVMAFPHICIEHTFLTHMLIYMYHGICNTGYKSNLQMPIHGMYSRRSNGSTNPWYLQKHWKDHGSFLSVIEFSLALIHNIDTFIIKLAINTISYCYYYKPQLTAIEHTLFIQCLSNDIAFAPFYNKHSINAIALIHI